MQSAVAEMSFPGRGPPLMPGMPAMSLMQHAYPMQPLMQQAVPLVPSVMFQRAPMPPIRQNRQQPPQSTYRSVTAAADGMATGAGRSQQGYPTG